MVQSYHSALVSRSSALLAGIVVSLREEDPVPFVTDFGKRTGRRPERVGFEDEVANCGGPLHLGGVSNKFTGETTEHGVGVPDIDSLVYALPFDSARYYSRYRGRSAAEQCIPYVAVVEDRCVGHLKHCTARAKVDIDTISIIGLAFVTNL
jgi:hypothetical protein